MIGTDRPTTIVVDNRTDEQRSTLPYLVVMTDRFLSGWGLARRGASYAAWACSLEQVDDCLAWVQSRSDALRVRLVLSNGYRPSSHCAHITYSVWRGDRNG